jgi:hypothetical protein
MNKFIVALVTSFMAASQATAGEKLKSFQDPKTKLHGFKNNTGKVVAPPIFEYVHDPVKGEELYPVARGGIFYRVNPEKKVWFASVFFDNAWDYYEDGLARFLLADKVGYHDMKGNVIIKPEYDFASPFKKGHAMVCNGCWGAYPDPKFRPLSSDGCHQPIKEQYINITGGKWGAINTKGQVVVPLEYDDASEVYDLVHKEKK